MIFISFQGLTQLQPSEYHQTAEVDLVDLVQIRGPRGRRKWTPKQLRPQAEGQLLHRLQPEDLQQEREDVDEGVGLDRVDLCGLSHLEDRAHRLRGLLRARCQPSGLAPLRDHGLAPVHRRQLNPELLDLPDRVEVRRGRRGRRSLERSLDLAPLL